MLSDDGNEARALETTLEEDPELCELGESDGVLQEDVPELEAHQSSPSISPTNSEYSGLYCRRHAQAARRLLHCDDEGTAVKLSPSLIEERSIVEDRVLVYQQLMARADDQFSKVHKLPPTDEYELVVVGSIRRDSVRFRTLVGVLSALIALQSPDVTLSIADDDFVMGPPLPKKRTHGTLRIWVSLTLLPKVLALTHRYWFGKHGIYTFTERVAAFLSESADYLRKRCLGSLPMFLEVAKQLPKSVTKAHQQKRTTAGILPAAIQEIPPLSQTPPLVHPSTRNPPHVGFPSNTMLMSSPIHHHHHHHHHHHRHHHPFGSATFHTATYTQQHPQHAPMPYGGATFEMVPTPAQNAPPQHMVLPGPLPGQPQQFVQVVYAQQRDGNERTVTGEAGDVEVFVVYT